MKSSLLFIASTLLCYGCFLIKENTKDPDRMAITTLSTPVYEGVTTALSGTKLKDLPPMTEVYVLRDSLNVDGKSFVGISWNDSTGYVPVGWLLLNGKPALLDGAINTSLKLFSDAGLSNETGVVGEWQIVSALESEGSSVMIIYAKNDEPATAFVPRDAVSFDSLNFEFFKAFINTHDEVEALDALSIDPRFKSLASFQMWFPVMQANENDTPGDNIEEPFVMEWRSNDGRYLSPEEYPGDFAAYFVFEDSTQSKSSVFGATMSNGYSDIKVIAKIKLVFIPKLNPDFTFEVTEQEFVGSGGSTKPVSQKKEYRQVEPGKTYAWFLSGNSDKWCNDVEFTVTLVNGLSCRGLIKGECGD